MQTHFKLVILKIKNTLSDVQYFLGLESTFFNNIMSYSRVYQMEVTKSRGLSSIGTFISFVKMQRKCVMYYNI